MALPQNPAYFTPDNPVTLVGDKSASNPDWTRGYPLLMLPEGKPGSTEYEEALDKLFHELHNWLSQRWLYRSDTNRGPFARNPLSNYERLAGVPDESRHEDILAPFGQRGLSTLQDTSFFSSNLGVLSGLLSENGLHFSVDVMNPEFSEKALDEVASRGAEGFLRGAAAQLNQQVGEDFSEALTDPSVYVPDTEEGVMGPLSEKEQVARDMYDLLRATAEEVRLEYKLGQNFLDANVVSMELGEVRIENGAVRYDRLTGHDVAWLGPDDIRTAEDADAWGVFRTLPLTQCVTQYGGYMDAISSREKFLDWVSQGVKNQPVAGVPINGNLGWRFAAPYFHGGDTPSLLESRIYVKLLRFLPFALTIDGVELSDEQVKLYKKRRFEEAERVLYTRLTPEEAAEQKAQGREVYTIPIVELWESVRLGASHLMYRRPAPGQIRREGQRVNVQFPIVAQVLEDTSLVTKGISLYELHTNIMTKLRKQVAMSGMKTLIIDSSEIPEGSSVDAMLIEANELNALVINGQRTSGAPTKESYKHMTTVDLGLNDDIMKLLNLAATIRQMYDSVCGVTPGMRGEFANREALGQTQLAKLQGTLISHRLFASHSEYVRNVIDRIANLGKFVWAKQRRKRLLIGERGIKTLNLAENINMLDYGIYLSDSMKGARDKEFLMSVTQTGLSSGQVGLKEMVQMYYAENPYAVLSIFRDGLSAYEKLEAQQMQASSQSQQMMAEAAMTRATASIQAAEVTGKWKAEVEKMQQEFELMKQGRKIEHDEDKTDINNQQQIKRDLMLQASQQQMAAQ